MVWAFLVAAVAILYLALRFRRFRSWVEPVLTIVVAIGLAAALLIWFTEDRSVPGNTATGAANGDPSFADAVVLSDLAAEPGQTGTSFRISGTVTNGSATALQSFRVDIVLSDCPADDCREIGRDSALIILRLLPGETRPFSTFAVFPGSDLTPVTAARWAFTLRDPRPLTR